LLGGFAETRAGGRDLAATGLGTGLAEAFGFAVGFTAALGFASGFAAVGLTFFRGDLSAILCLVSLAMQSYSVLSPSRGREWTAIRPDPLKSAGLDGTK
jgi:hypothetical protein